MVWDTEIQTKYDEELGLIAASLVTVTPPATIERPVAAIQAKNEELQYALNHPSGTKQEWMIAVERIKAELSALIEHDNQVVVDNHDNQVNYITAFNAEIASHSAEESTKWQAARNTRNWLLSLCDWTQLPDAPITEVKKAEWTEYRVQLRDIPETYQTVSSIVWPSKPV